MKTYSQLVFKYIRNNKKRTLSTIIAVIICSALITAVGTLTQTINKVQIDETIKNYGAEHVMYTNLNSNQARMLLGHLKVKNAGIIKVLGTHTLHDKQMTVDLQTWDFTTYDIRKPVIISGQLPQKENEIALTEKTLKAMGLGDEIGVRIDIEYMPLSGPEQVTESFILCGIIKNMPLFDYNESLPAIISQSGYDKLSKNNDTGYSVLVQIKDGLKIISTIDELTLELNKEKSDHIMVVRQNAMLIYQLGENPFGDDITRRGNNIIQMILVALVVLTTIAGIYNVFNISVLERIKQFGLIRCIGATTEQIRKIVRGEAVIISALGIPLGILIGLFLSLLIVLFAPQLISSDRGIVISPLVIGLSSLISLATVMISVFLPSKLASKVSPMEAVQTNSKVLKQKMLTSKKWHKIFNKIFGISGKMAYQNLWRNKIKFVVSAISMSLGVILFIVFSYWVVLYNSTERQYIKSDYRISSGISFAGDEGFTIDDYNNIISKPGVKQVERLKHSYCEIILNEGEIQNSLIYGFQTDMDKYLKQGSYASDQIVLIHDPYYGTDKAFGYEVGDEINIRKPIRRYTENLSKVDSYPETEYEHYKFQVGGIIDNPGYSISNSSVSIFIHEDFMKEYMGITKFSTMYIYLDDSIEESQINVIETTLRDITGGVRQGRMVSYTEQIKERKETLSQIRVLLSGLIFILALTATLNMANSISSNLITRTKELGTMRAVGMSNVQLRNMLLMEGSFFGVFSSLWGCIIGIGITYLMNVLANHDNGAYFIAWTVPWSSVGLAMAASILVGILSTYASVIRLSRLNIIESIRALD